MSACRRCGASFRTGDCQRYCSLACALWARVEIRAADECWPWLGRVDDGGYGRFEWGGELWLAHRAALIVSGRDPGQLRGLHSCDNPPCCNPQHLFPGTQAENISDMMSKGRHVAVTAKGSEHTNAKLSDDQVRRIRSDSRPNTVIAVEFGITSQGIGKIKRRLTYFVVA